MSPELKQQIIDDVIDPIIKNLDSTDASSKSISDMLAAGKAQLKATDSAAVGMLVPGGMLGRESVEQIVAVINGDAPTIKKSVADSLSAFGDMSKNAGPNAPVTTTIAVKPDAATVDGVAFDQFSMKTDFNGNNQQAMQMQQMMAMMYGPNGMSGYIGAVSDKAALVAFGIDSQSPLLADAIASAKSGKDVVSSAKTLQAVDAQLPKQRAAVFYVYIDRFVSTIAHYAQGFGMPVHINMPADLPPIGAAVSSDGTTVRIDGFVATPLVTGVVGVVNDLKAGGPGGPGGGGGPGGAQGL
jgi:hypothetical protein